MKWVTTLVVAMSCAMAAAEDWPMFRGPNRDGISKETAAPLEWGKDKNVLWRVKLPAPGNSSPIVWGDKVFLATAQDRKGTKRALACYDAKTGNELWTKAVSWDKPDPTHGQSPHGAGSPATDGQRVVVWHGSAGVHCYDMDGKELWQRDLGLFRHIWGYAGSPVILGDLVYLNAGPGVRTFIVALNKNTGEITWQHEEPGGAEDKHPETKQWVGSWATPVPWTIDGKTQLVVAMPNRVMSFDPAGGKVLWTIAGTGPLSYADVMLSATQGVALSGFGGPAIGFKLGGAAGDATASHRLWRNPQGNPQRVGSGVILGDHLYIASEPQIQCYEVATGKVAWQQRAETNWSSVVAVGDRLYFTTQRGSTWVVAADPTGYRLLAKNDLGEMSNSTIAVSNGRIYLRTWESLYCIAEK